MHQPGHRPQRHLSRSGFTVLEALMSLGLICLVLSILGSLLMNYSRVLLHQGGRQKSLLGCQVAVESVRRDVGSAVVVTAPATDRLHIEQIDPLVSSRLPSPLPNPPNSSWRPHVTTDRMAIDYRLVVSSVVRRVTLSNGATFEDNVTDDVDGLSFSILANDNVQVTATALINGQLQAWSVEVGQHLPPRLFP